MPTRHWMQAVVGLALGVGGLHIFRPPLVHDAALGDSPGRVLPPRVAERSVLFSAPGLTEPKSRVVQMVSEISGSLEKIHVLAGDRVRKGQLLAELNHDLHKAQVDLARAVVDRAGSELARLKNGERPEEVAVLEAQVREARALRELTEYEWQRVGTIRSADAASERELAQYRSARDQAAAREQAAQKRLDLARAGARSEDMDRARAAVREAEAQLAAARSLLEKTYVRSPIDGMVVYRHREPGESVFSDAPTPILSLGDRSRLHVRVDVDEMDIARVRLGQEIYATAAAFTDRRFEGRVVHIEPTLGRKNFRTDRPTEKIDTRVQEIVVELDAADDVPLELQMDVWFLNRPLSDESDSLAARHEGRARSPADRSGDAPSAASSLRAPPVRDQERSVAKASD